MYWYNYESSVLTDSPRGSQGPQTTVGELLPWFSRSSSVPILACPPHMRGPHCLGFWPSRLVVSVFAPYTHIITECFMACVWLVPLSILFKRCVCVTVSCPGCSTQFLSPRGSSTVPLLVLLMVLCVVSILRLLCYGIMILWRVVYTFLCECTFYFFVYIYLRVELLGMFSLLFTFEEWPGCFPEPLLHFKFLLSMHTSFLFHGQHLLLSVFFC